MKKFLTFIVPLLLLVAVSWPQIHDFFKKKELSYAVTEPSKIIQNIGPIESQTNIVIGEHKFSNPYVSFLEIENTGDFSIKKEDFEKPITITTSSETVLLYSVIEKVPKDLDVKLIKNADKITIEPLLLNSGDKIKVQFFGDEKPSLEVSARIVGIKEINQKIINTKRFPFEQFINSLIFILLWYLFLLWCFRADIKNIDLYETLLYTFAILIILIVSTLHIFTKLLSDNYYEPLYLLYLPALFIFSKIAWKRFKSKPAKAVSASSLPPLPENEGKKK
ncbi:MAG: hypothetical protein ABSF80_00420 [Chitinispirillaceae bacterium]|jgi:hypothetical protein